MEVKSAESVIKENSETEKAFDSLSIQNISGLALLLAGGYLRFI